MALVTCGIQGIAAQQLQKRTRPNFVTQVVCPRDKLMRQTKSEGREKTGTYSNR